MRSSTGALVWEIWRRNRLSFLLLAGLLALGCVLNTIFSASVRATGAAHERILTLDWLLVVGSMFLVFGAFNYTEFNPRKEWSGFPYRLFTLPVPTWRLVALPMLMGASAAVLNFFAWMKLVLVHDPPPNPGWFGLLLGVSMMLFQSALWTLAGFRILRILVLGFGGVSFVFIGFLPFSPWLASSAWASWKPLSSLLVIMAVLAYMTALVAVGRQRAAGGQRNHWLKSLFDATLDKLPRRHADFSSPSAAQFWFEWRRSGLLLPMAVAALLLLFILPLSWRSRGDAGDSAWVLFWTLVMPVIIAATMGKGFSTPDLWSGNMSLPSFLAARPVATGEFVVIKMKVAALSVIVAWALVLGFLAVWFPLWADLDAFAMLRVGYWTIQGHSVLPQYLMAALFILAEMLVTWKFLTGGLWIGLSGNRKWFLGSVAVYCGTGLLAFIALNILLANDVAFRAWIRRDPDRLLSIVEWILAAIVIAKFWLATFSWRGITSRRALQYLMLWAGSAAALIMLAFMLWAGGLLSPLLAGMADLHPLDPLRLQHLLVLGALAAVPLARVGMAPTSLAQNRHGAGAVRNDS
jgi:hypothetical protein